MLRVRFAVLLFACGSLTAPAAPSAQQSDLDAFMARVLARRDENWKKLQQYILDEREHFDLTGPGGMRIWGFDREYTWFIRDGYFIRSPTEANGVKIGEDDRLKYERDWMQREQRREKRAAERAKKGESGGGGGEVAIGPQGVIVDVPPQNPDGATPSVEDVLKQTAEPQFVSAAYFMRFKFDPGHYALAGREKLDDREVLRIEYYPSKLFSEGRTRPNKKIREREERIEQQMNKVSLVTLWIDPKEHQIIKYTFENIDMDFLPARWLLRVDELKASMTMGQAFPNVWLPASIEMGFGMTVAVGSVDARYEIDYHDYRLAEVTSKIKVKPPGGDRD